MLRYVTHHFVDIRTSTYSFAVNQAILSQFTHTKAKLSPNASEADRDYSEHLEEINADAPEDDDEERIAEEDVESGREAADSNAVEEVADEVSILMLLTAADVNLGRFSVSKVSSQPSSHFISFTNCVAAQKPSQESFQFPNTTYFPRRLLQQDWHQIVTNGSIS